MNELKKLHDDYKDQFIANKIEYTITNNIITYNNNNTHNYKLKCNINDNLNFLPIDKNPNDTHLIRMINMQQSKNNILRLQDFVKFIVLNLNDINNYCTICNTKLTYPSNKINICSDIKCKYKSEILQIDNYVTDIYKREPVNFCILIRSALCALKSPKRNIVFEPFPDKYRTDKDKKRDVDLSGDNCNDKDFDKLIKIIPEEWFTSLDPLIQIMDSMPTDNCVVNELGIELYEIIRFILKTNNTELFINNVLNKNLTQIEEKIIYQKVIQVKYQIK